MIRSAHNSCRFAWVGLATSDPALARMFYCDLFGWAARELDTGTIGTVTVFTYDGRDVAILYSQTAEARSANVDPHWTAFISVPDAEVSIVEAAANGASVLREPFDVRDDGRVATLQDTTGAIISLWQPLRRAGAELVNSLNAHCATELRTEDLARSKSFYGALFGWRYEQGSKERVHVVDLAGPAVAMYLGEGRDPLRDGWLPSFLVEDPRSTASKAEALGATNQGRARQRHSALIIDPTGAAFAVVAATSIGR